MPYRAGSPPRVSRPFARPAAPAADRRDPGFETAYAFRQRTRAAALTHDFCPDLSGGP